MQKSDYKSNTEERHFYDARFGGIDNVCAFYSKLDRLR